MYNIPCNKDLIQACEIPLATVITPFADVPPTEVDCLLLLLLLATCVQL